MRPDTETLQQRISSQAPTGRAFSDTNVSDISTSPNTIDVIRPQKYPRSSSPQRPASFHFDETDSALHKSSSQGNLRSKEKLPSVPNRTAMHELIRSKSSKKRLVKSKSMPDPESPNADRLLEVPFEDLMKGNVDKNILNGASSQGLDSKRRNSENKTRNGEDHFISGHHHNHQHDTREIYADIIEHDNPKSNAVCSQCLREGKRSINCHHNKDVITSVADVTLDENDVIESRQYRRQFSDILLIPGPFEDQDRLVSPDDSTPSNVL